MNNEVKAMEGLREERIGGVKLDLRYYKGDDQYSDGDETENRLLRIVTEHPPEEFPGITTREKSWPMLYHLSPIRENILNWIEVLPGQRILELGSGCGAVTGALLGRGARVTCLDLSLRRCRINATRHRDCDDLTILVGASEDILPQMTERFDHITLIGVLEYAAVFSDAEKPYHQILNMIRERLADDGNLWVAIENKLGLKYFAGCREDHTGRYFEGIEGYPHREGPYTFGRGELARLAGECGYDCEFYYPYPDYKFPVKIFSDSYLPQRGELNRNWQCFDADRVQMFDEARVFDTLLDEGLFGEFANSFLVRMRKRVTA